MEIAKSRTTFAALGLSTEEVKKDYKIAYLSRQASLLGRKEVLTGKAKFGIFGDGKEIPQLAMARAFRKGDWRSGYYRDQTLAFALGVSDLEKFFAQLYADTNLENEPASGGRQMNSHFATRFVGSDGQWKAQTTSYNVAADLSPTASQMARVVGLAYASKLYRGVPGLAKATEFSLGGSEVAFATIGNASTAEGIFWEAFNAAGVLQVPLVVSVWDDDYGISVPNRFQMTKESISEIAAGFASTDRKCGYSIYQVNGWDYPELVAVYGAAVEKTREKHEPCLIHVTQLAQPQGHSTSGSHERYKSPERLKYEEQIDGLQRMRQWMCDEGIAAEMELAELEGVLRQGVEAARKSAWRAFMHPIEEERAQLVEVYQALAAESPDQELLAKAADELGRVPALNRKTIHSSVRRAIVRVGGDQRQALRQWEKHYRKTCADRYNTHLQTETAVRSPLRIKSLPAVYDAQPEMVDGRVVIQRLFNHWLGKDPRVFIIGEDVGKLGGVNLEFDGLSDVHGDLRITDTGIREATILGQGIGAAMRGLRPVVDIQYLDYLLYAFQVMSDDLATLHYRTAGGQSCPVIVRTKGHRLEGIWHTGSPMGVILSGLRGMHVCVPRNMTQAAGMYNTLFSGDDPGLVIEVLNGYRVKEPMPSNLDSLRVPLGIPEVLRPGRDVTVVTYGACVRVAEEAADLLAQVGIDVELIDVQTLLPFDRHHVIADSIRKTHSALFLDEDVPGGASAYMLQQVMDSQSAYDEMDSPPKTLSAKSHRSAYGTDGDYYSKPSSDDVFDAVYQIMHERMPGKYPDIG